jgi:hypothetical protein
VPHYTKKTSFPDLVQTSVPVDRILLRESLTSYRLVTANYVLDIWNRCTIYTPAILSDSLESQLIGFYGSSCQPDHWT